MALQVWLPLTKDLRNQGLSDVTVTNNGATFNSAGKLGGCYQFNASGYLKETSFNWSNFNTSEFSICCWYKEPSPVASGNSQMICIGTSSGWNNIRIGLLRRTSNGYPMFSVSDGTNNVNYNFTADSFTLDTWNHIVCTYNNGTMKMYLNGTLHKTATTTIVPVLNSSQHLGIGAASNGSEKLTGYLNDVRIYDHCLSPMEVKQLAQGLVLHYPLSDDSIQQLSNVYNYPTFETTATTGGWSHWGPSGHSGNYGQSTDKNYIYRKTQTYAHWVSENAGTSSYYLLYQSPSFSGGYRSLQCICKEENGLPITEAICYPGWNARNGGVPADKWTSIIPLENDFYLCKCEGISQDGSNNLIGFHVKPGHKVYFSEAYVENDRECCSDIFYPTNIIYDTSGFCNNGTAVGTFTISSDTPKYSVSQVFASGNNYIDCGASREVLPTDGLTVSLWINYSTWGNPISCTEGGGWNFENSSGIQFPVYVAGVGYKVAKSGIATSTLQNGWHMLTGTFDKTNVKIYIDGVLKATTATDSTNEIGYAANHCYVGAEAAGSTSITSAALVGKLSDVRIYATALSASDVKSLYQNCATIDPDGTIRGKIR